MLRPIIDRLAHRNFHISFRPRRCAEEDEDAHKKKKGKGQRLIGISGYTPHADGGHKTYKLLTYFLGFPLILAAAASAYMGHVQDEEDFERKPYVKYEYLNRRTKRFPWGDGVRSLFHNPHKQALPDGTYDEEHGEEEHCDDDE